MCVCARARVCVCVRERACVCVRARGAGWCRVLEDVGEDCLGLLAQVMFFSSTLFMQFGLIFPPRYLS